MNRKSTAPIPDAIAQLQREFDQFRSTRPRRTKLPEPLWQAAVKLAREHGIYSVAHPSDLARKCNSLGKQKACRELAKLSERDKDTSVRIEAIGQLTDESVLAHILGHELFPAVRQAAEARLKAIRSAKMSP